MLNPTSAQVEEAKAKLWSEVPVGMGYYLNVLITRLDNLEHQLRGRE